LQLEASWEKSSQDPLFNQWLGAVVSVCHPSHTGKHKCLYGWTRHKVRKITKAKRAGSVVQEVEHLFSKKEALSSNLNTAK
jgi:hypothetical protein